MTDHDPRAHHEPADHEPADHEPAREEEAESQPAADDERTPAASQGGEGGERRERLDRRPLVRVLVAAAVLALAGGAAFGFVPFTLDADGGQPEEERTERTVASLPEPSDEPAPVDDHFPTIEGLESREADPELTDDLEEALEPAEDAYSDVEHVELLDDEQPVAVISLLRVDSEEDAAGLRERALTGLGELFEEVSDGEVAEEPVIHAASMAGVATLWVPDTDSVIMITAVDLDSAESVLAEVVESVKGPRPSEEDAA